MELYFVGDGPRDEATVPRIVEHVLGRQFTRVFRPWKNLKLHQGSGFGRKLRLAIEQARDAGYDGIIATVDKDKDRRGDRLKNMQQMRATDRSNPANNLLPTALGEANPHLEAWLLDDGQAVKSVLQIPDTDSIPTLPHRDPKNALGQLIDESPRQEGPKELLGEIASAMEPSRCQHSSTTGFTQFVEDVGREFPNQSAA